METIIKYNYDNNNYEFTSYLTDESLGDLQELLLNKLNISLINIKYIQCKFTINNEENIENIGQTPFHTKLTDFLLLKDDVIFNLIQNDQFTLNNYHYSYLDYIRLRNLNDFENNYSDNLIDTNLINTNLINNNNNYIYYFTDFNNSTTLPIDNNNNNSLQNIINDYSEDIKIVLTDEEINQLIYGKYSDLKINDEEYKCPITLKTLDNNDDVVKLPCNHIFCKNELLEWVSNDSNKCPMCRSTISNGMPLL